MKKILFLIIRKDLSHTIKIKITFWNSKYSKL